MFAVRDPRQKAAAPKIAFEARKLAKLDDPGLVQIANIVAIEKFGWFPTL